MKVHKYEILKAMVSLCVKANRNSRNNKSHTNIHTYIHVVKTMFKRTEQWG